MISGKPKEFITINMVLDKISPYDIYRFFCPTKFSLNQPINSPFRRDSFPSFVIGTKHGEVRHIDFGDIRYRGDCVDFVMQLHNLPSITDTLKLIDKSFGLGITGEKKDYKKTIITYDQPKIIKKDSFIQVVPRKFTKEELKYWNEYHQDIEYLKRENINSISRLYFIKKQFF